MGRRVSLAEARQRVAFQLLLPTGRAPDHVFVEAATGKDAIPGGVVSLLYGDTRLPHLLVQEFLGGTPGPALVKGITPSAIVEPVTVHGQRGIWLGSTHTMSFVDAGGVTRGATTRLAGRTLIWVQGELTVRIEGAFSKRQALELADSFR